MALAFALLFAVGAHLRPVCDVSLAGEPVARGCSLQTVREAERTAAAAAEEILRDDAPPPLFERRVRLSFRRPGRETRPLTDALLRATAGISSRFPESLTAAADRSVCLPAACPCLGISEWRR